MAVYEILFLTFVCYKDSNLLNLIYVVYSFHHDDNYIFMPWQYYVLVLLEVVIVMIIYYNNRSNYL